MEVRLDDSRVIFPFKASQDELGLIRLLIEFVLDMRMTHHHIVLYHQEISKISILKGDIKVVLSLN